MTNGAGGEYKPGAVGFAVEVGAVLEGVDVVAQALIPRAVVALVERVDLARIWHLAAPT